jgi:hypothetical protein
MFRAVSFSTTGTTLAEQFTPLLYTALNIISVETFRTGQPFLSKRGMLFVLLAQLTTGAVALPLYYATLCYYGSKHNPPKAPILPERAWTVLLSTFALYLLPSKNIIDTRWSYDALAIWQMFPIYLSLAHTILPTILKPLLGRTSTSIPIFLLGLAGTAVSASKHFKMVQPLLEKDSLIPGLKEIFLPWYNNPTELGLTHESHLFFTEDFLLCTVGLAAYLVLAYGGHGSGQKVLTALAWVALTALVGAGGATSAVWASTILFSPEIGKVDELEVGPTINGRERVVKKTE